jgi:DnaJ-class molecular chaperone
MVATDRVESPCRQCGGKRTIKCKACKGEGGRQAQRLAETSFDFRSFARARGWEACPTCHGSGRQRCECQR